MDEQAGEAGQVIAGRYKLEALIGQGGMGCVWRAQHLTLQTPVAIKLLTPQPSHREELEGRFVREAKAAAALRSSNVVQILDHGVEDGMPFIAMELLEGESLKDRLEREGTLSPRRTAEIMKGVVRGVGRAHRAGIVHRDLKPDNIFLAAEDDEAGGFVVKVLDFGIAKLVEKPKEDGVATRTGAMMGTPFYMSPEQARGLGDLDARSDLWSLAVIVFECLTGQRPFEADIMGELVMRICSEPVPVPSSVAPVPAGFDEWFARAVERDRAARFPDVRSFATALFEVLTPNEQWLEPKDEARTVIASPRNARGVTGLSDATTASSSSLSILSGEGAVANAANAPPRVQSRLPLIVGGALAVVGVALAIGLVAKPFGPDSSASTSASAGTSNTAHAGTGAAPSALRDPPPQASGTATALSPPVVRVASGAPTPNRTGEPAPSAAGSVPKPATATAKPSAQPTVKSTRPDYGI